MEATVVGNVQEARYSTEGCFTHPDESVLYLMDGHKAVLIIVDPSFNLTSHFIGDTVASASPGNMK